MPARLTHGPVPGRRNSGTNSPDPRYRQALSASQLRAFFDAADAVACTPFGGSRHLVIPVLFRMMYCLGLRPGETRRLHRNDVDLTSGTVWIRESKGHKDRIVYMSADLHDYCRSYEDAISARHPQRIAFFPSHSGGFFSHSTLDHWFRELGRVSHS